MITVAREDGLDFTSQEYRELFSRSDATLFQHPMWLCRLYGQLVPALGAEPVVVTAREAGRLVLVLPLVARRRGLARQVEFADLGVSDHAAPVLDPSAAERILDDHGTRRAIRDALGPVDLVWVDKVVGDPTVLSRLLGVSDVVRQAYDTHTVELGCSFGTWREETLAPRFVRSLDKQRRRLNAKGKVVLRELVDTGEIEDAMRELRELRRARFAGRRGVDLMQDDAYYAFYTAVARDGVSLDGPVRTRVLTVDDRLVAASVGLADPQAHVGVLVGYDTGVYRHHSLGLLMVDKMIEFCIERGETRFEMSIGNEPYKADFAARPSPIHVVRGSATWRGALTRVGADRYASARRMAKRVVVGWEQRKRARAARRSQRSRTRGQ